MSAVDANIPADVKAPAANNGVHANGTSKPAWRT